MIVTNKMNLPKAFELAVKNERHNKAGCYSATTLLHGVKETILTERHYDELETDVADNVWAIFGTAVHSIMENQNDGNEKEMFLEYPVSSSKVTGRIDNYNSETGIITDWKTASVWKIKFADFEDWRKQGLIYAWLCMMNGLHVSKCRFIALLKDHSKTNAKRDVEYPQSPVYVHEFKVTPADLKEIETFIYDKVHELEAAEKLVDDEIAPCTAIERWALMKYGRKTALKLYDTEEEAEEANTGKDTYVEHRPGVNRKCQDYCLAKSHCNFCKKNRSKWYKENK